MEIHDKVQLPDGRVGKIVHLSSRRGMIATVQFIGRRQVQMNIGRLTLVPKSVPVTREDGRPRGADPIPEPGARVVTTCYGDGENSPASVELVTSERVFLRLDPDSKGTSWRGWFRHGEYRVLA